MIKHYIMTSGGFGIPLMIIFGNIYIVFAAILFLKKKKVLLILTTILLLIIEWILIYMYTAHQ